MKNASLRIRFTLSLLLLLSLASCVSTRVSSLKDPTYAGHRFGRILVFGDFSKISAQKEFEDAIVSDLKDKGVYAMQSYQLLPPLRTYTDSERVSIFHQNQFDSYVIVSLTGTNTRDYHVPTYTTGSVAVSGNGSNAYGSGSSETTGGYDVQQVSSYDLKAELFDFNGGKLVCRCEATTKLTAGGQTWATEGNIVSSASSNLVDEMAKNDLFIASH